MPKSYLARDYIIEDHLASQVPVLERRWYHGIEIEPGVWSRGLFVDNLLTTRAALRNLDVTGARCLDIDSMEGLVAILLERKGAAQVVAYDRMNFSDRVALMKQKGLARFDYVHGFPLADLARRLEPDPHFDVVLFSGVLYHMLEPLAGLLMARRHLRPGGIMVFESLLMARPEMSAQFNAAGTLTDGGDNFWLLNVGLVDYLLRFVRLRPIDVHHLSNAGRPTARVCVVCEAVDEPPGDPADTWIRLPQARDFAEYLDWRALREAAPARVRYAAARPGLPWHPWGSVDLWESVARMPPLPPTESRTELGLALSATA